MRTLFLFALGAPALTAQVCAGGAPLPDGYFSVTTEQQSAQYYFDAKAGDQIAIQGFGLRLTYWPRDWQIYSNPSVSILSPDGQVLGSGALMPEFSIRLQLPVTGALV